MNERSGIAACGSRIAFYVLLSALFLLSAGAAFAQTREVSDDEVNEVSKDLFCPVCENVPLDVCPTQACADWRALVRTQLAEGRSKEEVHEYFARQYGDGVLAAPPKRGFSLVLWFFPVIAVITGGGLFARYMRRLRREGKTTTPSAGVPRPATNGKAAAPVPPPASTAAANANPDYIARIEAELQDRN